MLLLASRPAPCCVAVARVLHSTHTARAAVATSAAPVTAGEEHEPHVPVLLQQVVAAFDGVRLQVRSLATLSFLTLPDFPPRVCVSHRPQCHVDATLGAGGHASAVLAAHPETTTFVGLDQDPSAHALAEPRVRAAAPPGCAVHCVRSNFGSCAAALASVSPPITAAGVNGALFDLGMSSMQVDTPQRGFSFLRDGPLDMRMDPEAALSAEDVLNTWTEAELGRILRDYGEERRWRAVAKRLVIERAQAPIRTTSQVAAACAAVLGHPPRNKGDRGAIHPATRTFQALRIAVNAELAVLEAAMPAMIDLLAPGGRLAVISFHSLEDRIVKHLFRDAAGKAPPPDDAPSVRWGAGSREPAWAPPPAVVRLITPKPLIADEEEARANPRARSAKLRVVEKL